MSSAPKLQPRFYVVPAGTVPKPCQGRTCTRRVYWIVMGKSRRVAIDCDVEGGRRPSALYDPRQLDAFDGANAVHDGRGRSHNELCPDQYPRRFNR